jgi:hypothetical protein
MDDEVLFLRIVSRTSVKREVLEKSNQTYLLFIGRTAFPSINKAMVLNPITVKKNKGKETKKNLSSSTDIKSIVKNISTKIRPRWHVPVVLATQECEAGGLHETWSSAWVV